MRTRRLVTILALLGLLLGGLTAATSRPVSAQQEQCFAETGFCVRGRFLDYWQANGGLARNGFPLSEERRETLEDGREYTVQYFERVRLELHPENAAPYDILLGQFGRRQLLDVQRRGVLRANPPASPATGQTFFPESGHNLGGRFLSYWQQDGGLAQFGFPLTEEFTDYILGTPYRVQYFERGRFEYHPENSAPYDVLLGQLGRQILGEVDLLRGGFARLYATDEAVRARLGAPIGPEAPVPGATQAFERGLMVYLERGETFAPPSGGTGKAIYVLCGERRSGRWIPFADTWTEGQSAGGGPAPTAGLYYPQRGFGKVWRENPDVQSCVGYARTADEQGAPVVVQPFQQGLMLYLTTPEGPAIYVLSFVRERDNGPITGVYERH